MLALASHKWRTAIADLFLYMSSTSFNNSFAIWQPNTIRATDLRIYPSSIFCALKTISLHRSYLNEFPVVDRASTYKTIEINKRMSLFTDPTISAHDVIIYRCIAHFGTELASDADAIAETAILKSVTAHTELHYSWILSLCFVPNYRKNLNCDYFYWKGPAEEICARKFWNFQLDQWEIRDFLFKLTILPTSSALLLWDI